MRTHLSIIGAIGHAEGLVSTKHQAESGSPSKCTHWNKGPVLRTVDEEMNVT